MSAFQRDFSAFDRANDENADIKMSCKLEHGD